MNTPDFMPILSAGKHNSPKSGACVMEMASYLAGEEWSDSPACTHPVLANMARTVNDRLSDSERGALLDLLPRLMGTTEGRDRRTSVALAVWCAEQVAHLAGSAEPQAREAVHVTRAWLADEATSEQCRAAATATVNAVNATNATNATYYAADSAVNAVNAVNAAADAADAAWAADSAANAAYFADAADESLVDLLTGLLDEYDRLTGRGQVDPLGVDDIKRLAALTN